MIPILNIVINSRIIHNSFCEAGISLILKPDKEVIERRSTGRTSCGPVVKNLPASVGDMGSIPGPERAHMPQGT